MTPLPLILRGPIKVCANTLEILTFSFLVSVFFAQGVGDGVQTMVCQLVSQAVELVSQSESRSIGWSGKVE